ncbi:helix-turn-helix domain-containing protein [Sphingobacterium sp. LRF_L2]|uniref:helix-turn-helix domain-containing protein n=1 Tax=Sphingobacterium sp. LRF_L2 TaxID=3369421 RepID=UPI003F64847F
MNEIKATSLEGFYRETSTLRGKSVQELLPPDIQKEIGHFNVFDIQDTIRKLRETNTMPYNRRQYYKISLIQGRNRAEYADKVIEVEENAILFASPKIPYRWIPLDENQGGSFCIFTEEFMHKTKTGINLDEFPLFCVGMPPIFTLDRSTLNEITALFGKIKREISSDYTFKYDLIRNYVLELLHMGQKLQPASLIKQPTNPGSRVTSFFAELLERQFPIESLHQRLALRTAKDYADRLAVHVNHLNKMLKEHTGKTTTQIISDRIIQEAKILLRQTDWSISEIGYTLGFEEVSHFSNFFKKSTTLPPQAFRK